LLCRYYSLQIFKASIGRKFASRLRKQPLRLQQIVIFDLGLDLQDRLFPLGATTFLLGNCEGSLRTTKESGQDG
jgi:hypothetical protein